MQLGRTQALPVLERTKLAPGPTYARGSTASRNAYGKVVNCRAKRAPLWSWVLAKTDWLAVVSCLALSAGLILYCVTVADVRNLAQAWRAQSRDCEELARGL